MQCCMDILPKDNTAVIGIQPEYYKLEPDKKAEVLQRMLDWIGQEIKTLKL